MATTTPNLGLVLPDGQENFSRQVINGNFSMIDGAVGGLTGQNIPTVTGTATSSGVMTITVECKNFAFGDGLVFPVLVPEDIQTDGVPTLMMDVGGSGAKYLELHATKSTTFNNISAGVHFVECTTQPLGYSAGTEAYAIYETGVCGTINGLDIEDQLAQKATKSNPAFTGKMSLNRKSGTTEGTRSIALGNDVTASGTDTVAFGKGTIAKYPLENVSGKYNLETSLPAESFSTSKVYHKGDMVQYQGSSLLCIVNNTTQPQGNAPNSSEWTDASQYAEVVGNGVSTSSRSNARVLDWQGNERLMGDLYVECNANSTGGKKVATIDDVISVSVSGTTLVIGT